MFKIKSNGNRYVWDNEQKIILCEFTNGIFETEDEKVNPQGSVCLQSQDDMQVLTIEASFPSACTHRNTLQSDGKALSDS